MNPQPPTWQVYILVYTFHYFPLLTHRCTLKSLNTLISQQHKMLWKLRYNVTTENRKKLKVLVFLWFNSFLFLILQDYLQIELFASYVSFQIWYSLYIDSCETIKVKNKENLLKYWTNLIVAMSTPRYRMEERSNTPEDKDASSYYWQELE